MDNWERQNGMEAIAIIGIVSRFLGAKNVNEFWQNLRDGVESIFVDIVNKQEEIEL